MSLTTQWMRLPVAATGPGSVLPSIFPQTNVQTEKRIELDEDDELFFDLGRIQNMMPYKMQSLYTRRQKEEEVLTAVLENESLRAVFLPDYGGRLWSLFDKKANRELLYANDCLQPANLALLNAWASGGVEWNIGMIGHSPLTCAKMSMARVPLEDGSEALRFYAYERIRGVCYQMDFSLPAGSTVLLCRMRIKNLHNQTIPMYWFSNIALPKIPGARVIVPAHDAYFSNKDKISKCAIPVNESGLDVTYAENSFNSIDYFYKIDDCTRKFIAYADPQGIGMFQVSTARQKGRKLFVWGECPGGQSWQKWLTNNAGDYIEIQAGVGRTQYECIPMPPNAAWEWLEAYGPLQIDPDAAHGDYGQAISAAAQAIDKLFPEAGKEASLKASKASLALRKGQAIQYGDDAPWGALERMRRELQNEAPFEEHLDFGKLTEVQQPWLTLLETGEMKAPKDIEKISYQISPPWESLLQAAEDKNWYIYYQLGLIALTKGDRDACMKLLGESLELESTPLAHYAMAVCLYQNGDKAALEHLRFAAAEKLHGYVEFNREHLQILCDMEAYREAVATAKSLPPHLRMDGQVRYFEAVALSRLGKLDEAEAILMEKNTYQMPGMREGQESLSDLWFYIRQQKAELAGEEFDPLLTQLPQELDYRMA